MTIINRTLSALRRSGYTATMARAWPPDAMFYRDVLSVADIIAVRPGEDGVLLVQCTTASNLSASRRTAVASGLLRTWLAASNRFELFAWSEDGENWGVRREELAGPE